MMYAGLTIWYFIRFAFQPECLNPESQYFKFFHYPYITNENPGSVKNPDNAAVNYRSYDGGKDGSVVNYPLALH